LNTIPYAETAAYADNAGSVNDSAITNTKLGSGAITADKFAPGAVNNALPAALLASLSANDTQLQGQGYSRVQTFPGKDWVPSLDVTAPSPRVRHTAIWTGASMIVWGGTVSGSLSNQGGAYAAASKTWTLLSTANAPVARADHTAVWTGSQMLIWGGVTNTESSGTASGGIFSISRQAWRALSATSAPSARTQHTAVWCADRMIVWGGNSPNGMRDDGGSFIPPLDAAPLTDTGAWTPLPASAIGGVRRSHSALWTGSRMIVWGGLDQDANLLSTGAALNPSTGMWAALSSLNAPSARFDHTAIWTGSKMIVFGGADSQLDASAGHLHNDGAIFDPLTNTWAPLPVLGAPEARAHHAVVWSGSEMLVFGGTGVGGAMVLTAGAFNPTTNSWRSLSTAPVGATLPAGSWSGDALLTFGASGLNTLDPSPTLYLYGRF
jgi:N-acetylneuraminic acid mutarotase